MEKSVLSKAAVFITLTSLLLLAVAAALYPGGPDPYSLLESYGISSGKPPETPYSSVARSISGSLYTGETVVSGQVDRFIVVHRMMRLPVVEGLVILPLPGMWSDGERVYSHMQVVLLLSKAERLEARGKAGTWEIELADDVELEGVKALIATEITIVAGGVEYMLSYAGDGHSYPAGWDGDGAPRGMPPWSWEEDDEIDYCEGPMAHC